MNLKRLMETVTNKSNCVGYATIRALLGSDCIHTGVSETDEINFAPQCE